MNKIDLRIVLAFMFCLLATALATFGQSSNCRDEDFDCRIQAATKAIQAQPNNAGHYLARANAYDDKGDFDSALKDYNKALELDSKNTLIYYNRGLAFYSHRDTQLAINDFAKVIELDPKYAPAYASLGNAYDDLGKTEQAMSSYNQAIILNPGDALAYINRGIAYNRQNQYRQAIDDFSAAIKLNSEYTAEAYKNRAIVYGKTGENAKAAADRQKYEELSDKLLGIVDGAQTIPPTELRAAAQSKYKVGQMWSYKTRASEDASYLIIVKIENHPQMGNIIHIALMNIKIKRAGGSAPDIESAAHLPFAESAINQSVVKLLKENAELPKYEEGYNLWRKAFDAHQAGIYTVPVAKAVEELEATINQ